MNKLSTLKKFVLEVYQVWVSERPSQLAAALAYFGIFSFSAVLYIAYWLAGLFIDERQPRQRDCMSVLRWPWNRDGSFYPGFQ